MRAMRFSEGRIIEAMREHEAGAGALWPRTDRFAVGPRRTCDERRDSVGSCRGENLACVGVTVRRSLEFL